MVFLLSDNCVSETLLYQPLSNKTIFVYTVCSTSATIKLGRCMFGVLGG